MLRTPQKQVNIKACCNIAMANELLKTVIVYLVIIESNKSNTVSIVITGKHYYDTLQLAVSVY